MTEPLAFTKTEAAKALSVELRFFNREILPSLKVVRIGRKVLVPRTALEQYLFENAAMTLEAQRRKYTRDTLRALEGSNRDVA